MLFKVKVDSYKRNLRDDLYNTIFIENLIELVLRFYIL
jgi:hypothetical protein